MIRQALIVAIAVLGMSVPIGAAAAELTACGLITDAEFAAFTGGEFEREDMPPPACSVDTMEVKQEPGELQARRYFFRGVTKPRPARPAMQKTNVEGSGTTNAEFGAVV